MTQTQEKLHYVYQTKNLVNGKTYIGVRSTYNINDGYMGCGFCRSYNPNAKSWRNKKGLVSAIRKYGVENFVTMPMSFFNTAEEAYEEEEYLVTEEWINRPDTYNRCIGGKDGRKRSKSMSHAKLKKIHSILDREGIIYKFKNITDFAKRNGLSSTQLGALIRGKTDSYKGFILASNKGKVEIKTPLNDHFPINVYYKNEIVEIHSPVQFSELVGVTPSTASAFCLKKQISCGGAVHVEDGKPVGLVRYTKKAGVR